MAEADGLNGVDHPEASEKGHDQDETLLAVLQRIISIILYSDGRLVHRIKTAFSENAPLLKDASVNSGRNLHRWTRRGSPLRALFVASIGSVVLLTFTGLLIFMVFFVAATVNAIVISLLMSLAAAGGFLALFFACVAAVYIGALAVAIFVISTATICAITAVFIVTGWIGFFWAIWLVMRKSTAVAKNTLSMTGSAISAYSSSRRTSQYSELDKGV